MCTRGEDVVVAGFRGNLGGQCPIRWEDHADVELRAETARELGPEDQPVFTAGCGEVSDDKAHGGSFPDWRNLLCAFY